MGIGKMKIRRICQMCFVNKFDFDPSKPERPEDKFCPTCRQRMGLGGPQQGAPDGLDAAGRPVPQGPKKTISEIARSGKTDIDWSQLQ